MAYRIAATTDIDRQLLDELRDLAWRQRIPLSQLVREAFAKKLGVAIPKAGEHNGER